MRSPRVQRRPGSRRTERVSPDENSNRMESAGGLQLGGEQLRSVAAGRREENGARLTSRLADRRGMERLSSRSSAADLPSGPVTEIRSEMAAENPGMLIAVCVLRALLVAAVPIVERMPAYERRARLAMPRSRSYAIPSAVPSGTSPTSSITGAVGVLGLLLVALPAIRALRSRRNQGVAGPA